MGVTVLHHVVELLFDLRQRQMFIPVAEACEQLFTAPRLDSDCAIWCGHNDPPFGCRIRIAQLPLSVLLRGGSQHCGHRENDPRR
jgi:hypothetical protein